MKSTLPVLSLALLFASCTSVYKSGQTPDDVYFSPQRPAAEYVSNENKNDQQYRGSDDSRDDRYLRLMVQNRRRSVFLDDDYYSYNPYYYQNYNNNLYYNSPWNSYSYWNYCYNPYYPKVVILNPKTNVANRPRTFNLNVYNPPTNTNESNVKGVHVFGSNSSNSGSTNTGNYRSSGTNAGNFLRNVFSNSGSSGSTSSNPSTNSNSSSAPARTSSGSSSGGGSSSSGGSAPVRRF